MKIKGSNLYLIKLTSTDESFYKIGVSVHEYCRFYEIMKYGYDIEIIYMVFNLNCYTAYNAEKVLQNKFNSYLPKVKFGGYTECFLNINLEEYRKELNSTVNCNYQYIEGVKIDWR